MADKKKKSGGRNLNFLFIIGLILAILTIIFAIQNAENTEVNFFSFSPDVPRALLIFGSILLGSVLTLLFSVPGWFRRRREKAKLKSELKELRKNYEELAAVQPKPQPAEAPKVVEPPKEEKKPEAPKEATDPS